LKPYQGYKDYYTYVQSTFQKARDNALNLLKTTTNIKFKPSQCESGYFVALDVSGNEGLIPDRYKKPGNYESDPNTLVFQRQFSNGRVPLDFQFCRYLAVEKGLVFMPLSSFCLEESPHKVENMVRLAICKPAEAYLDENLIKRIKNL
jgi:aspartate/methionine/tyrosine aminotransferase